jgi:hypothetical protein
MPVRAEQYRYGISCMAVDAGSRYLNWANSLRCKSPLRWVSLEETPSCESASMLWFALFSFAFVRIIGTAPATRHSTE